MGKIEKCLKIFWNLIMLLEKKQYLPCLTFWVISIYKENGNIIWKIQNKTNVGTYSLRYVTSFVFFKIATLIMKFVLVLFILKV